MSAVPPPPSVLDLEVPWHYGDPLREQRYLIEGVAAVDMSNHGVLTVTGPDRLSWLHSLTTQHLLDLQPGTSALALILSPHGHVEHELHVYDDGDTAWIITQPGRLPELLEYLDRMRFMLRVEVADRTSEWSVVGEPDDGTDVAAFVVPEPFASRGYALREAIVPRDQVEARLSGYERRAGSWAREALRAAAAMPRFAMETDHKTIPNEVGWLNNAVHLNKGCYRGQETVAKVNNLGQPPRRLALLHLDGSSDVLPVHGTAIELDGRAVGYVATPAQHYELGPISTAVLKRSVPVDADLSIPFAGGEIRARE